MSSQFHNRLVGTVVLVALGVIFLPDILDGKKARVEEQFAEIPLRPEASAELLPASQFEPESLAEDDDAGAPSAADESVTETATAEPEPERKPAEAEVKQTAQAQPQTQAKPVQTQSQRSAKQAAWTVQLGAFSNAANVQALVKKLRKAGFSAYTLPARPVDGKLTKVYIGPDVSQEKLTRLLTEVEKLTQLKGKVVAYDPLES
ncbi:SPOR domain-containing protein [Shewanella sedimentimangrovi]|uniref:SPOR domain-containing protein n=1 Tax=Shewanella sedimentimangrovi TaxID=2814293 RepID=A0ABX7QY74_9GAMM|nr:SPOR domain-containing protein [Shewanella sedimentimangrovi]QSX35935.1 SPOR domain-containing protein [Shewanella sedimentimangrovi]